MSDRRRRRKWPWLVLVLAAMGLALLVARKGGAGTPPVDPALIVKVKRGPLAIEIVETGKIAPRERVEVKSKVAGQASQVLVDEGQKVHKGQLLLVLDPTDYQRDVARAEADVAQARSALDYARLVLERKKAGVAQSVMPQSELDLAAAEAASKSVALRSAQVALTTAQDRVSYTRIVAPIDGTVIQRGVQPGEVVVPGVQSTFDGKSLLIVADLSVLVAKIELNQIDVAKVKLGQSAELVLDALPGQKYQAKITKIAPASVRPTGKDVDVFPVEAQLAEADGKILPGMTADVRVHLDEKPDVLTLPIEAVVKDSGKSYVTRLVADAAGKERPEKTEVTLGARSDRDVEIVSGVEEGARVVLNPPSAAENETKM